MPGSIRSMHLEHVLRNVQTDRGSLLHGRLLRWQFDTVTLAHRCRRGASTPSPNSAVYAANPAGPVSEGQETPGAVNPVMRQQNSAPGSLRRRTTLDRENKVPAHCTVPIWKQWLIIA